MLKGFVQQGLLEMPLETPEKLLVLRQGMILGPPAMPLVMLGMPLERLVMHLGILEMLPETLEMHLGILEMLLETLVMPLGILEMHLGSLVMPLETLVVLLGILVMPLGMSGVVLLVVTLVMPLGILEVSLESLEMMMVELERLVMLLGALAMPLVRLEVHPGRMKARTLLGMVRQQGWPLAKSLGMPQERPLGTPLVTLLLVEVKSQERHLQTKGHLVATKKLDIGKKQALHCQQL